MNLEDESYLKNLIVKNEKKILLVVLDGLGDIQGDREGTPLEMAVTPNLDRLARDSSLGFTIPVRMGITPGSGPAHLSLFGYDPLKYQIGRGILEALGLDLEIGEKDLCVRANFATFKDGLIVDRRAGRIPTEKNVELCKKLSEKIKKIDDIEVKIYPGKEHRFVVIFSGEGLSEYIEDVDPQKNNKPPVEVKPKLELIEKLEIKEKLEVEKTVRVVKKFIEASLEVLKDEERANYILMRGFSKKPLIEPFNSRYGLKSCGVAVYPMYRGLARLVGMDVPPPEKETWEGELELIRKFKDSYDFFYLHLKETDKAGEDGNFDAKVSYIEKFDSLIPELLELKFDVMVITGDHSTPSYLSSHSWHPNPVLIYSPYVRKDGMRFTEANCRYGSLGFFYSTSLVPLMLAHSLKLKKFGA